MKREKPLHPVQERGQLRHFRHGENDALRNRPRRGVDIDDDLSVLRAGDLDRMRADKAIKAIPEGFEPFDVRHKNTRRVSALVKRHRRAMASEFHRRTQFQLPRYCVPRLFAASVARLTFDHRLSQSSSGIFCRSGKVSLAGTRIPLAQIPQHCPCGQLTVHANSPLANHASAATMKHAPIASSNNFKSRSYSIAISLPFERDRFISRRVLTTSREMSPDSGAITGWGGYVGTHSAPAIFSSREGYPRQALQSL